MACGNYGRWWADTKQQKVQFLSWEPRLLLFLRRLCPNNPKGNKKGNRKNKAG